MTHPATLWSAALVLWAGALPPSPQVSALDSRPMRGELPPLPGLELAGPRTAPAPATLERDAALADRFTAQGQSVRYDFTARAGELSIFELSAVGFARGWSAAATLRVLDADGNALAEERMEGGVQFRPLLAFTAPAEGAYALEVSAAREYFRYALVRHSGYAPRAAEPVVVDGRGRVHGWLAGGDDVARFRVPARAGETLVLKVEGTREEARQERRLELVAALDGRGAAMGGMTMGGMRGDSMRAMDGRGPASVFPALRLEVPDLPAIESRGESFARLVPDEDGLVEVAVRTWPGAQAVLFDLLVQRAEPVHPVRGIVVDADDEPCAGIELLFLREPDLDPWTRTASNAAGYYHVELPAGDYRVQLQRPGRQGAQLVRAGVARPTELNLLLTLR